MCPRPSTRAHTAQTTVCILPVHAWRLPLSPGPHGHSDCEIGLAPRASLPGDPAGRFVPIVPPPPPPPGTEGAAGRAHLCAALRLLRGCGSAAPGHPCHASLLAAHAQAPRHQGLEKEGGQKGPCPGPVRIDSASDVKLLKDCSEINGDLIINAADSTVSSVDNLRGLTKINGDLLVRALARPRATGRGRTCRARITPSLP